MAADRKVVLDASAMLAWLLHEKGANAVDRMLPVAVLPVTALTETLYRAVKKGHRQTVDEIHATVLGMGVEVEPALESDADRAATLILDSHRKATPQHPSTLSLGDGLCLATAERLGLPVTGGDLHWETMDLEVPFLPFR